MRTSPESEGSQRDRYWLSNLLKRYELGVEKVSGEWGVVWGDLGIKFFRCDFSQLSSIARSAGIYDRAFGQISWGLAHAISYLTSLGDRYQKAPK